MLDEPLGGDPRHHVVGLVHSLAALVAERERQSVGDLVRRGGAKVRCVGHDWTVAAICEHVENIDHDNSKKAGDCVPGPGLK
jgi:hypothetical protein